MKKTILTTAALAVIIILASASLKKEVGTQQQNVPQNEFSNRIYTHKNLTIFLIQGKDELQRKYLTLEEAMQQKKIILNETGSVGELSADNISSEYVFIMAGDIVKGGRQDRTIGEDIVLAPGSKKIPLKSFCVEQSRWSGRGSESASVFSSSEKMLNNKALKVAARTEKNQHKVWEEVSGYQTKISDRVQSEVKSSASPSSLQLTLENDKLKNSITEYVNALQPAFEGKKDVLGFAFFVNGKISTVETFGNADLFRKLQKKLLEAAASEAFEQYDEKLKFETPILETLNTFIEMAGKGTETVEQTSANMTEYTKKTEHSILLRSVNTDAGKAALHTSIYSTEGLTLGENKFEYGGRQRNINRMIRD
ncbi:MAG: hypothetical protein LBE36_10790 [Flavobacteriaceae bacterium]|jgi:hypothetical protein|nr:hypothetical protein [Flavobacteriaceae bacterium]